MSKVWRSELESTDLQSGLKSITTQHWQTDLAALDNELSASAMLDEIQNHFGSTSTNMSLFTACMHSALQLTKLTVREEVAPGSGDVPEVADKTLGLTGTNGAITGDQLPIEACMWVRFRTGTASRSSRGGTHLPPHRNPNALTAAGLWDTAVIAANPFLALINKMIAQMTDTFGTSGLSDINPVIYSRTRRARGLSPYTFRLTESQIRPRVAWVRRRGTPP